MDFSIVKSSSPQKQQSACVVVGVFETCKLSPAAEQLDKASCGYISLLLEGGNLEGKLGQTLILHKVKGTMSERVLLVGCGKEREFCDIHYKELIQRTIEVLSETGSVDAISFLTDLRVEGHGTYWKVRQGVEATREHLYRFDKFKNSDRRSINPLRQLAFSIPDHPDDLRRGKEAITHGLAIASGVDFCKDLGNMPPNVANPTYLASQALDLANGHEKVTTEVIDEEEMKRLGMNSYLAVGRGSDNPSAMSVIDYKGHPCSETQPIVLVGKGMTFDSGGLSLKPGLDMDEMKYDMCGAASVLGTMKAITELDIPLNVVGVVAGCENMPSGRAYRPGDILTTMSGQTVEVLNTDAEGRLVLCDVLTYVERFKPSCVVDIATLTGACVIALGHQTSGVISNKSTLGHELVTASDQASDPAWLLPMGKSYQKQLKSPFADIANIGGRSAGTITAACFLSRFAEKYNWAHIDIAGTAWNSGEKKGSTGRPVSLLVQFILNRINPESGAVFVH